MDIKIVSESGREVWNNFVAASENSSILQSYEWGEFKSLNGWHPLRVALFEKDKIIACASILKRDIPFSPFSIFYAPHGPVLDLRNKKLLISFFEVINYYASTYKAILIKIDPLVLESDVEFIENIKSLGFIKKKRQIQPRATLIIDLTKSLDEIMSSFEEKTRYNIRLSQKKGVEIVEDSSDRGVDIFYKMYQQTAKRDKFLIHPFSYYKKIKSVLIDRSLSNVFLAYYEGLPIAGVITFSFGKKIWYMYGASTNEYRNVMPNHGLHWHIIRWAKEKGFKLYDLWGIPVNPNENHPLYGVYRFKKGFNGSLVKYVGAYDKPFNLILYRVFDGGLSLFQNLRSLIKKGEIVDSLRE